MGLWAGKRGTMDAERYITEHWDRNAVYNNLERPKHRKRFRAIAARAGHPDARTYCDVGCAFGHSTRALADIMGGRWTGVDCSKTAIEKAIPLYPEFEFELWDGVSDMGPWDIVICSEVIEHVPNDAEFAAGLIRAARLRFVVTTPAVEVNDPGHLRLYDADSLRELFAAENVVLNVETVGKFLFLTGDICQP